MANENLQSHVTLVGLCFVIFKGSCENFDVTSNDNRFIFIGLNL